MKRIRGHTLKNSQLPKEKAVLLLNQILDDLHLERDTIPQRKKNYRRIVVWRYAVKRAAVLTCTALLIFTLAPGTVIPAAVSNVSAAPASDSSSVQIYFQVDTLIPVKDVTAEINEHSLSITDNGYQQYEVTVEENGYLLLDVYSATGMHSSHGMEITGIDTDAPAVIGHSSQGDLIIIQISDGDGVGVDYDSITAYTEASGYPVSPAWCNEAEGTIAFTVPEETILIRIPDKNGNYRMLSLSPS